MKIKNFVKHFKEGVFIEIFQNFHEIFKYFIVHPYLRIRQLSLSGITACSYPR